MSVAFTKEDSAETAAESLLPERPISNNPNLVTPEGLDALRHNLAASRAAFETAQAVDDINERRRQSAVPLRDMRYYAERVRTAQLVPITAGDRIVSFGKTITFRRDDSRTQTFRIVGEDEANPTAGSMSYASPIARVLMGREVGDIVAFAGQELEITAIN